MKAEDLVHFSPLLPRSVFPSRCRHSILTLLECGISCPEPRVLMRPLAHKVTPLSFLILAWLIMWVTTVPLFHTHLPDTTDGPISLQGGVAHTVFSPDLPGEFSRSLVGTQQENIFRLSNRVSNSPELGILLLEDDPKHRKVGQPSVLAVFCGLPTRPLLPHASIESAAIHRRYFLFVAPQGPRPPPSVISL